MERLKALVAIAVLAGLGGFGYYVYSLNKKPPEQAPVAAPPAPVAPVAPAPEPALAPPPVAQPAPEAAPPPVVDNTPVVDFATEALLYRLAQSFIEEFLPRGRAYFEPVPHSAAYDLARTQFGATLFVTQNRERLKWIARMRWVDGVWQLLSLDKGGKSAYMFTKGTSRIVIRKGPAPNVITVSERNAMGAAAREAAVKQAESEKTDRKKPPAQTKPVTRTWTDATGKFTIEAEFRGMVAGNVKLRKANGQEIILPMDKLCEEDQQWIRSPAARNADNESPQADPAPAEQTP